MNFVVNVQKIIHDCRTIRFESILQKKKINSDHVFVIHGIEKVHVVVGTISSVFELLRKMPLDKCRFFVIDEADHESDKNTGNNIKNGTLVMYCRLQNRVKVVLYNATFHGYDICFNKYQQVGLKRQTYAPHYLHPMNACIENINAIKSRYYYPTCTLFIVSINNFTPIKYIKKHQMLKQATDAFEINQYLMFYCARLGCDDIHHYLTKMDEIDFYGEPNSTAGTQNKNVCAELCGSMPRAERNGSKN